MKENPYITIYDSDKLSLGFKPDGTKPNKK